jgi:hypothetical protein
MLASLIVTQILLRCDGLHQCLFHTSENRDFSKNHRRKSNIYLKKNLKILIFLKIIARNRRKPPQNFRKSAKIGQNFLPPNINPQKPKNVFESFRKNRKKTF